MTGKRLSSEAFAACIEQAELGHVPAGLHPEDAAHLAFALRLGSLRERPSAPVMPPWRSDRARAAIANTPAPRAVTALLPPTRRIAPRSSASGAHAPHAPIAFPSVRRPRMDVVVVAALVAVIALLGWQAIGRPGPDGTIPMKPPIAMPPRAQPEATFTPHGRDSGTRAPGAIDGSGEVGAVGNRVGRDQAPAARPAGAGAGDPASPESPPAYPPPASPTALPVATSTSALPQPTDPVDPGRPRQPTPVVPGGPSPKAGASATAPDPLPATQSAARETPADPTAAAPYPGPGDPLTPEPRVTRLAPPPISTREPTIPTPLPTAVASPTRQPLPTFPATPTAARPTSTTTPPAIRFPAHAPAPPVVAIAAMERLSPRPPRPASRSIPARSFPR